MSDDERDQRIDRILEGNLRVLEILDRLLPVVEKMLKNPMLKKFTGGR